MKAAAFYLPLYSSLVCVPVCLPVHSSSGAGDEEGLAVCSTLSLLRPRDAHTGLQPAAGVLPLPHPGLHGWGLRRQHWVHRPVSNPPLVLTSQLTTVQQQHNHHHHHILHLFLFDVSPQGTIQIHCSWATALQNWQGQWDRRDQQVNLEENVKTSSPHAICGCLDKERPVPQFPYVSFCLALFAGLTARTGSTKRPLRRETFCWTESRNCPELSTCKMGWSLWLCERPWWLYLILVCLISLNKSYFFVYIIKKKTFSDNVSNWLHFKLFTYGMQLSEGRHSKSTRNLLFV